MSWNLWGFSWDCNKLQFISRVIGRTDLSYNFIYLLIKVLIYIKDKFVIFLHNAVIYVLKPITRIYQEHTCVLKGVFLVHCIKGKYTQKTCGSVSVKRVGRPSHRIQGYSEWFRGGLREQRQVLIYHPSGVTCFWNAQFGICDRQYMQLKIICWCV